MRRDYFSLDVINVDWVEDGGEPARPTVIVEFEGPTDPLYDRLTTEDGTFLSAGDIDVAYRLQDPIDLTDARGVVGVTHRITGDFILELNERAESVFKFIRAARRYGELSSVEDGQYAMEITTGDDILTTLEKETLLVYDEDGNLLREHSLIPSGVEL